MTTGYLAKSIFQETPILYNLMVSNRTDLFNQFKTPEETCHIQQNYFLHVKDTQTFTLIEILT